MASDTTFVLGSTSVEVIHPVTIGGITAMSSSHITYTAFYNLLAERASVATGGTNFTQYLELLQFFGGAGVDFPPSLVRLQKQAGGYHLTQVIGGDTHIFPSRNADKSRVRVDLMINANKEIVLESITAYRYSGIASVGVFQEGNSVPLPALSQTIREIVGRTITVTNLAQAGMEKLLARLPQTVTYHAEILAVRGTDRQIEWERLG